MIRVGPDVREPSPLTLYHLIFVYLVLLSVGTNEVTVTSWARSAERNADVGGTPNSLHLLGLAMDLVGSSSALARVAAAWRGFGLQAIDEGDHLHLELDS